MASTAASNGHHFISSDPDHAAGLHDHHVIVMPYPLQGHITPLMQLSKLLASRGMAITFVTSEFNVRRMLRAKQEQEVRELEELGIALVGISDGVPDEIGDRDDVSVFLDSVEYMRTSFDGLMGRLVRHELAAAPAAKRRRISCVISDSFLLWAPAVAHKWRVPLVSFWPNSLTALACSMSVDKIMAASSVNLDPFQAQVYERLEDEDSELRLRNCIPGIPEIFPRNLPFYTLGGEHSADWMRNSVNTQREQLANGQILCVVVNSFPDLEREVYASLKELPLFSNTPLFALGPLLPPGTLQEHGTGTGASMCDEDADCIGWLDKQTPLSVLYISMGSMCHLDEHAIKELALGLEASKQPFLWVLRSASPVCEPTLARLEEAGQGKVIEWAPQLRVLSHGAVGGFLTHCGWNSTLESVNRGVPVIGWPQMIDQLSNCWLLVEKLKMGVRLEMEKGSKRVGRAGVERSVRRVMQEEAGTHMRTRASTLKDVAHIAFNTTSNLDAFMDVIVPSLLNGNNVC